MRIAFDPQLRLDSTPIAEVRLNNHCRDEIIPILTALQHGCGQQHSTYCFSTRHAFE